MHLTVCSPGVFSAARIPIPEKATSIARIGSNCEFRNWPPGTEWRYRPTRVMSNHLHLVLRTRPDWVESWSDGEVAVRWLRLFSKSRAADDKKTRPSDSEIKALTGNDQRMAELRLRLSSVSWFMRSLNEHVARLANREDGCKGRFWEGRFKCQALLDEAAVLACMAYVDLNPIRAGLAR